MKILYIAADTNKIGGIEKYNREFMDALQEVGVDVFFVPLYGINWFQKLSFILRVFLESIRKRPNIICSSHIAFAPICYFVKKILGIEYTVNVYGIEVVNIKSALHKRALRSAKFIIKLFDQTAQNVIKQISETAEKIITLPNSVDGEKFYIKEKSQNLIKRHNLKDSKIILTICRLSYSEVNNKGYERVMRIMPEVIKQIPNAKYLLVGGGNDIERIKNLIKELNLENNVILAGPAKDGEMVDYYNLADVFAYPSKKEGFPAIVLLEALACGKPIIGGSQGESSEEKIFNNKLGYIINPDNQQELKNSIINILEGKAPKIFFNSPLIRKAILDEYGKDNFKKRVKEILNLLEIPKLAIIMSHAIQYQAPLLRKITASGKIDLTAYFNWDFGVNQKSIDPEFKTKVKWDIPVLEGYKYKFLKNFSLRPSSNFWGQLNFGIVKELIQNRYDATLIYGWNLFTNWLAFFIALIINTPIILQGESPLNQELLKSGWKQKIKMVVLKRFFKHISAFLYIGEENKKFYESYGVPESKLFFCPYAVDNERFINESRLLIAKRATLRKELKIKDKDVVILFVGKLIEKKRPMDLLKAYELLFKTKNLKTKTYLLFVGDGVLRPELEKYIKENNLKNVIFTGFKNQTELPKYYTMADIFVLPSGIGETWGLVVNEAMCFGLPVIVSDMVGCGADLVKSGDNGYIFPFGDVEKLVEYLEELILNKDKRKIFGKKSFEIIQNYSHEKDIEGILEALKYIK